MEENELEHSHHYGSGRRNLAFEEEDDQDDDTVEDEMWLRRKNWMTKHGLCSWEGVQCHHRPGGTHDETHYDEVSLQAYSSTCLLPARDLHILTKSSLSNLFYHLPFRTTTSLSSIWPTMQFEGLSRQSCLQHYPT